jgi:hypothetical protein
MLIRSVDTEEEDDLFTDIISNPSPGGYVHSSQPKSQIVPRDIINISSNSDDDDIKPSKKEELLESSDDDFPDIDKLLSQPKPPTPTLIAPSSSRLPRERKPTTKQASQNRRTIEKQLKRMAKLARKGKTINTTQLDDVELPFRSSQ